MCRIAGFSGAFIRNVSHAWLLEELQNLERSMGGDGNGFYVELDDGAKFLSDKGVCLTTDEIAGSIWELRDRISVGCFHTRMTSAGSTCDEHCHPFVSDGARTVLVHNGHVNQYARNKKFSDSQIIAELIDREYIPLSQLEDYSSFFIAMHLGSWVVSSHSSGLRLAFDDSRGPASWFVANEIYAIPAGHEIGLLPAGLWVPGTKIPKLKAKGILSTMPVDRWSYNQPTYTWRSGYAGTGWSITTEADEFSDGGIVWKWDASVGDYLNKVGLSYQSWLDQDYVVSREGEVFLWNENLDEYLSSKGTRWSSQVPWDDKRKHSSQKC